jgi:hypothetical protein
MRGPGSTEEFVVADQISNGDIFTDAEVINDDGCGGRGRSSIR